MANAAGQQRAHDALNDLSASPKAAMQTPTRGDVFVHVQINRCRMAFYPMSQRAQDVWERHTGVTGV